MPSSDPRWKNLRGHAHIFAPRSLAASRTGQVVDVGQAMYGGALNLMPNAFCSADVVDVAAGLAQGLWDARLDHHGKKG